MVFCHVFPVVDQQGFDVIWDGNADGGAGVVGLFLLSAQFVSLLSAAMYVLYERSLQARDASWPFGATFRRVRKQSNSFLASKRRHGQVKQMMLSPQKTTPEVLKRGGENQCSHRYNIPSQVPNHVLSLYHGMSRPPHWNPDPHSHEQLHSRQFHQWTSACERPRPSWKSVVFPAF